MAKRVILVPVRMVCSVAIPVEAEPGVSPEETVRRMPDHLLIEAARLELHKGNGDLELELV